MNTLLERAKPELVEWLEKENVNYPNTVKLIKTELQKHCWWTDMTYEVGKMLEECSRKSFDGRVMVYNLFNKPKGF